MNAVDQFGKTALHEAVYRGKVCILDMENAWTNEICNLLLLSIPGDARAIEILAKNGANMNAVDQVGKTALHEAVYRGKMSSPYYGVLGIENE